MHYGRRHGLRREILVKLMYKMFTTLTSYKHLSPSLRKNGSLLTGKMGTGSFRGSETPSIGKVKVKQQNQNKEIVLYCETLSNLFSLIIPQEEMIESFSGN